MWKIIVFLVAVLIFSSWASSNENELGHLNDYSFKVDYENNQFLLDGKSFRYISGSFHYFRTPKQYWRDRLRKMRLAGLNTISTYVEWSLHEPEPNKWNWNGDANISEFLKIAKEEDLFVILRPGPYICAERDFGGFPTWLLNVTSDIQLRTNDPTYMKYVEKYLEAILTKSRLFLRGNGGPIIMVQIENEYGSFHACDVQYRTSLKNLFDRYIQSKAVLFTTDGSYDSAVKCGFIPGVYATIDFGTSSNVTKNFQIMRKFQPKGPLVNSEFYPGWLTHWGEPLQKVPTLNVVKTLDEILSIGASVNIYMFYGGTNFGFKAGANIDPEYRAQITSYDYDAPITEAGDLTPKYFAIRDVIKGYMKLPDLPISAAVKKKAYGTIIVEPVINLFEQLAQSLLSTITVETETTPSFEELHVLPLQLVLYETFLPLNNQDSATLEAIVHDRAYVYTDNNLISILNRSNKKCNTTIDKPYGKKLTIVVENQGHVNFGNYIADYKGLWNLTIGKEKISTWNVTGFALDNIAPLKNVKKSPFIESGCLHKGPRFFRANFLINEQPVDTYLDTSGWGKGVIYINGYNIGRYWPSTGPQVTLYVPGVFLRNGQNEIVILELEYVPKSQNIKFINSPKFATGCSHYSQCFYNA